MTPDERRAVRQAAYVLRHLKIDLEWFEGKCQIKNPNPLDIQMRDLERASYEAAMENRKREDAQP